MKPLHSFLDHAEKLLIIVAELPFSSVNQVKKFLLQCHCPMIIEPLSQLRHYPALQDKIMIDTSIHLNEYTHVLRIGGIPVTSIWRQLSKVSNPPISVLSVSHTPFTGLPEGKLIQSDYTHLSGCYKGTKEANEILPNQKWRQDHQKEIERHPKSEASLIHHLSQKIPPKSIIYLGNSMPIRTWSEYATYTDKAFKIYGSRGVNGIDGQLSTFFGVAHPILENWCILGDLTALYDLNAPWILAQLPELIIRIVIIHNGGGQIFSHLFPNRPSLINAHDIQFSQWAKMWGLSYIELSNTQDWDTQHLSQKQVIVLKPE
jgi:2-succinyl-5-enolpyruvyl-6-hydroxy-3-cyclohexene-1-carboxylate synthase